MEAELLKYINTLEKGEKISLVMYGLILDGTFEEVVDNSIVLSNATSRSSGKKEYQLIVPFESIYAWGRKQKKKDKKKEDKGALKE